MISNPYLIKDKIHFVPVLHLKLHSVYYYESNKQITFDENSYKNVRHLLKPGEFSLISAFSAGNDLQFTPLFLLIFLFNRQIRLPTVENNGIVPVPAYEGGLFPGKFHKSIAWLHYNVRRRDYSFRIKEPAVIAMLASTDMVRHSEIETAAPGRIADKRLHRNGHRGIPCVSVKRRCLLGAGFLCEKDNFPGSKPVKE